MSRWLIYGTYHDSGSVKVIVEADSAEQALAYALAGADADENDLDYQHVNTDEYLVDWRPDTIEEV